MRGIEKLHKLHIQRDLECLSSTPTLSMRGARRGGADMCTNTIIWQRSDELLGAPGLTTRSEGRYEGLLASLRTEHSY